MVLGVGGALVGEVSYSADVKRNGGAGVKRLVAVLEARVWSCLGMLERLILGPGVFRGSFFFFSTSGWVC